MEKESKTLSIGIEFYNQILSFVKQEKHGYNNVAEFVREACRERMNELLKLEERISTNNVPNRYMKEIKGLQKVVSDLQVKIEKIETGRAVKEEEDYEKMLEEYWEEKGMPVSEEENEYKESTEKLQRYKRELKK